jgi:8-oxo-dGTP pyrophosphatase MutT (NUDIX family)
MANNKTSHIIYPQSSVIPFQFENNKIRILLITSINSGKWIFPKGIIEANLTPEQSALQEAFEEGGIEGEIVNIPLGKYTYQKWGGTCEVVVFPMRVTKVLEDWPEAGQRKRKWNTINKAMKLLEKDDLKKMLIQFETRINKFRWVRNSSDPE